MTDASDLYTASYARLVGILSVAAGSRTEAEDVVQEAFARLLPRWSQVSLYEDPEAWVRKVAFRVLWQRARRRRFVEALAWKRPPEPIDTGPSGQDLDLTRAVATLSLTQREVVILHYLLDQPLQAVAAELGVPLGTVKSRLARARKQLESLLADEEIPM